MPECARCHRKPRKGFRVLALPVTVTVNYQSKERRTFNPGAVFCNKCEHSLDSLYGGESEGSTLKREIWNFRRESDGALAFEATVAKSASLSQ